MIKHFYLLFFKIKKYFQNNLTSVKIHNSEWKKESLSAENDLLDYTKRVKEERNKVLNNKNVQFENLLNTLSLGIDKYTIIDLGSGSGDFILTVGEKFSKIISVEPSEEGIKIQKKLFKKYNNIEYYNQTAENFLGNYKAKGPHLVFLFSVLMHIQVSQSELILKKLNEFPEETILVINEIYTNKNKNVEYFMNYAPTKNFFINTLENFNLQFMGAVTPEQNVFKGIRAYKKNIQ